MDDDTRMASGEAEHVLNRSRRVREEAASLGTGA